MSRRSVLFFTLLTAVVGFSAWGVRSVSAISEFDDALVGDPLRVEEGPAMVSGSPDAMAETVRSRMGSATITPELSVPIPGVQFTAPRVNEGAVEIPFLAQYISGIYRYALGIVTLIAIIMVMYGGFRYLLGATAGDAKVGRTIIRDALMGMSLLFFAYVILYTVNPKTVQLRPLRVAAINSIGVESTDDPTISDADPTAGDATGSCNDHTIVSVNGPNGQVLQVPRWKSHLKPMVYSDHVAWCADCNPSMSCGYSRNEPDPVCSAIAGRAGTGLPCGGQFGLFLRALTGGNCQGKSFDYLDGLDGFTYGIRNVVVWNMPGLMQSYANADRAAFERIFANANLSQWYQNGDITNRDWFCQQHERLKGLACDQGLRRALNEASTNPAFVRVQLQDTWNAYQQRIRAAQAYFPTTAAGQIAWAVLANNPGGEQCHLAPLMQACATSANERDKYECMLRTFVERGCRGGTNGAQRRVDTIRHVLQALPANASFEVQTLEDITNRCRAS